MITQLTQDLTSAKKQLTYTQNALLSNLENWERKEFKQVESELLETIKSLENRISFLK